eukprot:scaffold4377_cov172-Isochrysis_galbana.AAC.1
MPHLFEPNADLAFSRAFQQWLAHLQKLRCVTIRGLSIYAKPNPKHLERCAAACAGRKAWQSFWREQRSSSFWGPPPGCKRAYTRDGLGPPPHLLTAVTRQAGTRPRQPRPRPRPPTPHSPKAGSEALPECHTPTHTHFSTALPEACLLTRHSPTVQCPAA